jgi:hypothetical protein
MWPSSQCDLGVTWAKDMRTDPANCSYHPIKQGTNFRRFFSKVVREIVPAARVRLISIGELSSAFGTPPQRSTGHRPNESGSETGRLLFSVSILLPYHHAWPDASGLSNNYKVFKTLAMAEVRDEPALTRHRPHRPNAFAATRG